MTLQRIAPRWAGWVVAPAVVGFAALGGYFLFWIGLAVGSEGLEREGAWIVLLLGVPVAVFPLYVAYRGLDLVRFRNVEAGVEKGCLIVRRDGRSEPVAHDLSQVKVVDCSNMQVMHVVDLATGRKIFTVDYYYPYGMKVVRHVELIRREMLGEE